MISADHEGSGGENFVKRADELLLKELSRLSFQEWNNINEEIHGVRVLGPEETPELLERSLAALDTFLDQIITEPPSLKTAFNLSQSPVLNPTMESSNPQTNESSSPPSSTTYVNDRSFRLMFLRSELFDAKKAALRIIKYLDVVLGICGEYNLRRPIQLTDFTKEEMKILRSGCIQLLPYRDRAGRPILAFVGHLGTKYHVKLKYKILLYIFYNAGKDVESQRKGLIVLSWPNSNFDFSSFSFDIGSEKLIKRIVECTSIRLCAIHACIPDTYSFRMLRPFIVGAAGPSVRPRIKFFVETGVQRQNIIKGYGIPAELIPVTDTGNVKTGSLKQWIRLRSLLESEGGPKAINEDDTGNDTRKDYSSSPPIVEFPGSRDVLYRIGTTTSLHPGNAAFREFIEYKLEESQTGLDISLSMLADELIREIVQVRRGRFLKWDNRGYWTVLNDRSQTNTKVTASIRDFKRLREAKMNLQSVDSSTHTLEGKELKRRKVEQ